MGMTTGNDGEIKIDEPLEDPSPLERGKMVDGKDLKDSDGGTGKGTNVTAPPKKSKEKSKDAEIMEVGKDVPTMGPPSTGSPSYQAVNRAAILWLARHELAVPDLEDFKTAFPSMFA